MEELFFSATPIQGSTPAAGTFPVPAQYLWAVWDIYPGHDVRRPPLFSGVEPDASGLLRRHSQFDIRVGDDDNHHFNERLREMARRPGLLVSSLQRTPRRYFLAAWETALHYLMGASPVIEVDGLDLDGLRTHLEAVGAASDASGYARAYLRRKEAHAAFVAPPGHVAEAIIPEFVYADHNEKYIATAPNWKRHRVVRKTIQTIFIDRFAYCSNEHMRRGWQAGVIYTAMIDRAAFEETGRYYHQTLKTHFVHEPIARARAKALFRPGGRFSEPVLDLPESDIQWAMSVLGLEAWPVPVGAVKKAFAKAAMLHHPDRGGHARTFIECRAARNLLLSRLSPFPEHR